MKPTRRYMVVVVILVAVGLGGIGTKLYRGRFETWFHNYAGGIAYEVFWVVLLGAVLPKVRAWRIAVSVFVVTCMLEVLQLYHPPVLEAIRSSFLGRALIGDGFDPRDFVYYVIGSAAGWSVCGATRAIGDGAGPCVEGKDRGAG